MSNIMQSVCMKMNATADHMCWFNIKLVPKATPRVLIVLEKDMGEWQKHFRV